MNEQSTSNRGLIAAATSAGAAGQPLFISMLEAATMLGVSPSKITSLRDDGEIETLPVGRLVKVLVSSLDDYIERRFEQEQARRISRQAARPEPRGWRRPDGEAFPIPALDERRAGKASSA